MFHSPDCHVDESQNPKKTFPLPVLHGRASLMVV
jgi:hypothetical protein